MPKQIEVKTPKGDKTKQYDLIISVIHDDREGITKAVEKPVRYSFSTEGEALEVAARLREAVEE